MVLFTVEMTLKNDLEKIVLSFLKVRKAKVQY